MVHGSGERFKVGKVVATKDGFNVCALRQVDEAARVIVFDLNAEHPVQCSKVSDLKVLAEAGLEFIDKVDGVCNNRAIVHMHHHNGEFALGDNNLEVNGLVHATLHEPKGLEDAGELLVPAAARLLEPIKGLNEAQYTHAGIRGLVAWGTLHIQDLVVLELAIEICTFDVYLVHLEAKVVGHGNDGAHGRKLGHWRICVIVVDATDLAEALGDEAGLVANDVAGCILLRLEDPFGADDICSRQCLLQLPGTSSLERGQFLLDGFLPVWPVRSVLRLCERARLKGLCIRCFRCEYEFHAVKVFEQQWFAILHSPHSP